MTVMDTGVNDIDTDRLILRGWRDDEAEAFHRIWGDARVKWWGDPNPDLATSHAQLHDLITKCQGLKDGLGWWAVVRKNDGRVIGTVLLQPLRNSPDDIEVGYHFAFEAWGHGFATEAARALLNYGFLALGLNRIVAVVHVDNHRSLPIVERLGMTDIGLVDHAGLPHRKFERVNDDVDDDWREQPAPGPFPEN